MLNIIINQDKDLDGYVIGIFEQKNGSFLALTPTISKNFKTLNGAKRFLKNRGYNIA